MSLKVFLGLFIALNVIGDGRSQNQTDCVEITKDVTFPFDFLPEGLKRDESVWKNVVRKIANDTNHCLIKRRKRSCVKPLVKITFPVISQKPKIQLTVLPRPYLATKETSTSATSQVLIALAQIWKMFVISLMAAAISGVTIWFLDHKTNSGHFPKSFWRGTQEGLWWAIVTMTTVGYGDKTPKSSLGRVYASLWMIIGMLLMSSFTAQISSSITTDGLRPLDEDFGYEIGVPNGSKEFFATQSEGANFKEYFAEEDLFQSLKDGKVDKIWPFDCKEKGEKREFKIVKVLGVSPIIGAEITIIGRRKILHRYFKRCLEQWAWKVYNNDEDEEEDREEEEEESLLKEVASTILEKKDWESNKPKQGGCIENHSQGKYRDAIGTTPSQMGLADILLCISAGLLVIFLTTGALWDSCLKIRHAKVLPGNSVDIEKAVGTQELQSTAFPLKECC